MSLTLRYLWQYDCFIYLTAVENLAICVNYISTCFTVKSLLILVNNHVDYFPKHYQSQLHMVLEKTSRGNAMTGFF